jgi:hypothetical protein
MSTGLQTIDTQPGTGAEARKGQTVTVHYTGWLYRTASKGPSSTPAATATTPSVSRWAPAW